jgi:hypothetical protein
MIEIQSLITKEYAEVIHMCFKFQLANKLLPEHYCALKMFVWGIETRNA